MGCRRFGMNRFVAAALLAQLFVIVCAMGCDNAASEAVATKSNAEGTTGENVTKPVSDDAAKDTSSGSSNPTEPSDDSPVTSQSKNDAAEKTVSQNGKSQDGKSGQPDQSEEKQPDGPSPNSQAGTPEPEPKKPVVAEDEEPNPFSQQVPVPEFPSDLEWLNVSKPLTKADLKGKFVLLDFWTYCCINCMHILPELKKLEQAYPNQLVVIGVHSAKFETEKGSKNIEEAILRYEIEHPVINDADHKIWEMYGVRSWPTLLMIDPTGCAVWARSGEFQADEIRDVLETALPHYRKKKQLNETPLKFDLLMNQQADTPLLFPGKIAADEASGRLFIADSNHNRIVVTDLDGKVQSVIGSGARGRSDGDFTSATFDHPQGMVLHEKVLYIADTENHLLRKADFDSKQVSTVAGIGEQARNPWPGLEGLTRGSKLPDRWVGKPLETAISSPWDLLIHEQDLYIAMAGPHQIWKMPLDGSEIGPYAGNGREDIVDGPLLPAEPYADGYASFAQPSGLATDGQWIYVADSEGSSVRAVPFDPVKEVRTVVGTAELPFNRLFRFGDQDGERSAVLLQHCIGLTYSGGQIYVTDTYNNKVKMVDPMSGATKTIAGTGKAGKGNSPAEFDEPAGIASAKGTLFVADTNNHQIRTIDITSGKVGTLNINGLSPPARK
jgi:thiol-disulfide isomerase/thioredoxin